MRTRAGGLLATIVLGLALSASGARLEDLETMLKDVTADFRSMAKSDTQLREIRHELIAQDTPIARKRELFTAYRQRLSEQIERQQELVERVQAAMDAASGLPEDGSANLQQIVAGFDEQAAAWEDQIRQLQANAKALAEKDGIAGQMGRLQNHNLALLQQQFDTVRRARQKVIAGSTNTGIGHLRDMLQALHATALARETAMLFEFTVTSQNAQIFEAVTEIRSLYEQLIGPQDYTTYMRDMAAADVEATNAMIQATQMVGRSSMPMPEISDAELETATAEIDDMQTLMPYEQNGTWFYFDPQNDRWYILGDDGTRALLPLDPLANTGRYVRMHDDGHLYSEAPWYDRPRQLTFTENWQDEAVDATAVPSTP